MSSNTPPISLSTEVGGIRDEVRGVQIARKGFLRVCGTFRQFVLIRASEAGGLDVISIRTLPRKRGEVPTVLRRRLYYRD